MVQNLRTILFASIFFIIGLADCFAQAPVFNSSISSSASVVCQGSTTSTYSIGAATGTGITYSWSYSGTNISITSTTNGGKTIRVTYMTTPAATSGSWTVTATNSSGATPSSPFAVTVNPTPAQPSTITGLTSICQGQANVAYSVTSVPGLTYNWTANTGLTANFSGSTNSETANFVASAGTTVGKVNVTATNGACTSVPRALTVTAYSPSSTPGPITGTASVCDGAGTAAIQYTYTVPAIAGTSAYTWSYSGGTSNLSITTPTSNTIRVRYGVGAPAGDWTVTATNPCGTSAASAPFSVTVNSTPAVPGTITGLNSVCEDQQDVAYSVAPAAGAATYNWSYTAGGTGVTFSGNSNAETADFNNATPGSISVASVNASGTCTSANRSLAVAVNTAAPNAPGVITGSSPVCDGSLISGIQYTYSVSVVANAVSYTWSYSGGTSNLSITNPTSNTIKVRYGAGAPSGDWTVTATNTCGTSVSSSPAYSVIVNTTPATPGTITGLSSVCEGNTGVPYSILPVSGASSYNWSYNNGINVTFSGNTDAVTADFNSPSTGTGSLSVTAVNGSCASPKSSKTITVSGGVPSAPSAITGISPVCTGSTSYAYSVTPVSGVNYAWTYSGGAANVTVTGGTTSAISVKYKSTATSGDWTVTASNSCGTSSVSPSYTVQVNITPSTPGAITGPTTVCQGQNGVPYSVNAVSGLTYNWAYSAIGASFSGSHSNSESVDFASNATGGDISVVAVENSCISAASTITIAVSGVLPTTPGTITGVTPVCQGSLSYGYSVPNIPGLTYTWAYSGGAGNVVVSNPTSNSISVRYTAAVSGDWTVTATNACGTSSASAPFSVIVNATPAIPGAFTSRTNPACQGQTGTYAIAPVTNASSYNWSYTGSGATLSGSTTTSETVNFSATASNPITISVVAANGACLSGARTLSITVNGGMPATPGSITGSTSICRGTSQNAFSISPVTGATSYVWAFSTTNGITVTTPTPAIPTVINASVADNATVSTRTLTVVAKNGCGTSSASSLSVSVLSNPVLTVTSPQTANQGGTLTLVAPAGAATYAWTGPNSFASTSSSTSTVVTTNAQASNAGAYSLVATNVNGCFRTYPVTVTISIPANIFRSKQSGNFSSISSWEASADSITWNAATVIPSVSSSTVTIVAPHAITMNVAATVKNIIIDGTLNASSSNVLTINGEFINNGTFVHNNGTFAFSGDESNSLNGSATTGFYNLLVNKTSDAALTILSNVTLTEKLSFGTNATNELFIDNGSGGSFTFLSTASSSAHIDVLSSPLPILTGDFNCQHYFPAQTGRYSFMLGVPVTNTYINDLQPTDFDNSNFPIDGIYVSGPFTGSDVGNGLSRTASSSFAYSANTGLYSSYPASGGNVATSPLVIGSAYRQSVRDGGPSDSYATVVAKTLNVTGSLVTPGTFTYSGLVNVPGTKPFASGNFIGITTGGWNLISNPFMSDINVNLSDNTMWDNTNISTTAYIYDAATRDFSTCTSGAGNCIIPAFQGFFVQATGAPSLAIHEQAKVSIVNNASILRTAQSNALNYITIKLSSPSVTKPTNTIIRYVNGASFGNDNFDGFKLGASNRSCLPGVTTCLYTKDLNSIYYSINSKPYGLVSDTTEMNVLAPVGNATLDFSDVSQLLPIYQINLIDKFTNTIIDVTKNPVYNFTVTSDTNSWGPRFRVAFSNASNVTTDIVNNKLSVAARASVYPSPGAADKISVYADQLEGDTEFLIYDMTGRLVFNSKLNVIDKKAFQVFDLSRILQSGIYSTVIKSSNSTYSQRLIIR